LIQACIFDLDGVIVDTAHYHFLAWKKLTDSLNIPFTEIDNERLKGVSRLRSLEIVLELGKLTLPRSEMEALANQKNVWFLEYVNNMKPNEVFKGVPDLLQQLRDYGIAIALASSSKNAKTVLERIDLNDMFDAVVDGTMIKESKPSPEIFLLASTLLKIDTHSCLVFEDAEAGVQAAHAAGMSCVAIGSSKALSFAEMQLLRTSDFTLSMLRNF
jgi:beta-phosphoglucomutase